MREDILPGARDAHEICPAAKAGPTGAAGPKGEDGRPGANGAIEPFCLKLGNSQYGNCEKFPVDPSFVE